MVEPPPETKRRILYALHRGLTELRDRAQAVGDQQLIDLADALEVVPGTLVNWTDDKLQLVEFVLRNYQQKHPESRFGQFDRFKNETPPERF